MATRRAKRAAGAPGPGVAPVALGVTGRPLDVAELRPRPRSQSLPTRPAAPAAPAELPRRPGQAAQVPTAEATTLPAGHGQPQPRLCPSHRGRVPPEEQLRSQRRVKDYARAQRALEQQMLQSTSAPKREAQQLRDERSDLKAQRRREIYALNGLCRAIEQRKWDLYVAGHTDSAVGGV
eukprot:EG_transcript_24086